MRTEDDLRTALTTLERHAPAAAQVLPGSSRRARHGLRSPKAIGRLAGAATAAALAGVVTTLILPSGSSGTSQNGGGASQSPITKTRLLTALTAASGDIAYAHANVNLSSSNPEGTDEWTYPSQPSAGQQLRYRIMFLGGNGAPTQDDESIFAAQTPKSCVVKSTLVDYQAKTWSQEHLSELPCTPPVSLGVGANANMIETIKERNFKEVGPATVAGRRAIEFRSDVRDQAARWELWVDAATYLPIRLTQSSLSKPSQVNVTVDFQFLPATPANLAKLTAPIPSGFKRVAPPPRPATSAKTPMSSASSSPR